MGQQMGPDQVFKTYAASVPCHGNGLGIAVMRGIGRNEPWRTSVTPANDRNTASVHQ